MSEDDSLIDALAGAAFATTSALTRLGAEFDLSLTQVRVLAILRDRTVRMTELASYLGLEKSSLSGLIDRAVQRGLVERRRSEDDGRAFEVLLTDEGLRLADVMTARSRELLLPLVENLGRADRRKLRELLESIV